MTRWVHEARERHPVQVKPMSDVKAGEPTFGLRPMTNGKLRLILSDGARQSLELELSIEQVSSLAATALRCAKIATDESGLQDTARGRPLGDVPGSRPDEMGLAIGPTPGLITLVARYGLGRIGLPMNPDEARALGNALLQAAPLPK